MKAKEELLNFIFDLVDNLISEIEQFKNCNLQNVGNSVCGHDWDTYENKQGELIKYCHKCNSVEQTDC